MIVQGSPEWFVARLGKVTGSRIADLTAKGRSGPSASRANYLAQLVVERLTGLGEESFTSPAMEWGKEKEAEAREAYEFLSGQTVETVGFIDHPTIALAGASPDGNVGSDGHVEIKCPNTATHIDTLRGGSVPGKYVKQMQWQMACTGRQWCDFASYDPRMPVEMRLHVRRVMRDQAMIDDLELEVKAFLREVDGAVSDLNERYRPVYIDEAINPLRAC